MTCEEVFTRMSEKFEEFQLDDVYGVFQFNIDGNGGGNWHAICEGDSCRIRRGVTPRPDVTIYSSASDVVKLVEKRLSPAKAFFTRRVKIKGDLALLAKVGGKLAGKV